MKMLDGVEVFDRNSFLDERGIVGRIWRGSESIMIPSEVYMTKVNPGVIKGWHGYYTKSMLYVCVSGNVKLVLFDNREDNETYQDYQEIYLGESDYKAVLIPPGVMNAFKGISLQQSTVVVLADEEFDEHETIRWDIEDLEYDWDRING